MVENSCTNVLGRDGGVLLWEKAVSAYYLYYNYYC